MKGLSVAGLALGILAVLCGVSAVVFGAIGLGKKITTKGADIP